MLYRKELQEAMCCYVNNTLIYVNTVREFCERVHKWTLGRKTELDMMMDIKERAENISLNINHVTQSNNKVMAFSRYLGSKFTQVTADSRRAELEAELAAVLKGTLGGLEELHCFLDAVENLAVTSLHVFTDQNYMLHLPEGIRPEDVQVVISAAQMTCHLLIGFRRDATAFFLPKLHNVEVLSYQLDKYITTTQTICEKLEKRSIDISIIIYIFSQINTNIIKYEFVSLFSSLSDFCIEMNDETLVDLDVDLSENDIEVMLWHIKELEEIR